MPTFFSRRYMRGQPRRTERLVGVFVLVVLAFITGTFLLTSGLLANVVNRVPILARAKNAFGISEKPLFVPDPQNVTPPAPPHEMRIAESMLPTLPEPWTRLTVTAFPIREDQAPSPRVVQIRDAVRGTALEASASDMPETLRLLSDFGVQWVYRGLWRNGDGLALATVMDAGDPASAFGLWKARQPEGARSVALGRGGWVKDSVCSFWAGRYVTEVASDAESEGFARSLAAVQLLYGGPFWGDSVLPADGRVPETFRYVRKAPLGITGLADCWLADYSNGITMGVMQPVAPEKALAAARQQLGTAVPASQEEPGEGEGGYGGEERTQEQGAAAALPPDALGPDAVTGTLDGRRVAVFPAGPYVFLAASSEPEPLLAAVRSARDRWSAGARQPQDSAGLKAGATGQARFVTPDDPDIAAPVKIERYTDNLYEKIDGREGQFRAYNFVELRFGQYLDTRRQQTFDVYIYDMAEPLNAMGIYNTEKSPGAEAAGLGQDSYTSGPNVYFWKSKYYVNVLGATEAGDAAAATAKQIAAAIAETITDEGGTMWADKLLPQEDRVAGSFTYRATSALGYDFLQQVFLADYKVGGKSYQMFVMFAGTDAAAKETFEKFVEATTKYDKLLSRDKSEGGETMVGDSMGVFSAVFYRGAFFGGVVECDEKDLAVQRAGVLRDRLKDPPAVPLPAAGAPKPAPTQSGTADEGSEHAY